MGDTNVPHRGPLIVTPADHNDVVPLAPVPRCAICGRQALEYLCCGRCGVGMHVYCYFRRVVSRREQQLEFEIRRGNEEAFRELVATCKIYVCRWCRS